MLPFVRPFPINQFEPLVTIYAVFDCFLDFLFQFFQISKNSQCCSFNTSQRLRTGWMSMAFKTSIPRGTPNETSSKKNDHQSPQANYEAPIWFHTSHPAIVRLARLRRLLVHYAVDQDDDVEFHCFSSHSSRTLSIAVFSHAASTQRSVSPVSADVAANPIVYTRASKTSRPRRKQSASTVASCTSLQ